MNEARTTALDHTPGYYCDVLRMSVAALSAITYPPHCAIEQTADFDTRLEMAAMHASQLLSAITALKKEALRG